MSPAETAAPAAPDLAAVTAYLRGLQDHLCATLESLEASARFEEDGWRHEGGGGGITRVIKEGEVFEKGGVNFSHVMGAELPTVAGTHAAFAGRPFQATGVSLVLHPRNPYVPCCHMNVRFFQAGEAGDHWWFGGGYDLTPYYPFREDCLHWHRTARAACDPFDPEYYPRFKAWCDRYFHLPHRAESRGIGGLFFDDFRDGGFADSFAFTRSIGDSFAAAYQPIVQRRRDTPYGERERAFQCYRRGRYAEFNLVYDRGTLFGLKSGGRSESILMSLPPVAHWHYQWRADPGSPEAALAEEYLRPQDWLAGH